MGYSKSSITTRGVMRWRAYVNVRQRQVVVYRRTEKEAREWSVEMNNRFEKEKKMDNGIDLIREMLGMKSAHKEPKFIILFGCAIRMSNADTRCDYGDSCRHYNECLNRVFREGYDGWSARNIVR